MACETCCCTRTEARKSTLCSDERTDFLSVALMTVEEEDERGERDEDEADVDEVNGDDEEDDDDELVEVAMDRLLI